MLQIGSRPFCILSWFFFKVKCGRETWLFSPYLQADLINQLYQGKLKDYVRCLECGYESWRIDTYLDIPLVIRPFGASQAYGSVVCFSPFVLLSIYFITAALNIY